MNISELKEFLLWSVVINYGIILIWFGAFAFAHEWLYHLHNRWFKVSTETFDVLNYLAMALYKIGIIVFNLGPLIALYIISWIRQH